MAGGLIVPPIITCRPGELIVEAGKEVEESSGDDDIVVERDVP